MAGYGIDINTLGNLIARPKPRACYWGQETILVERDEFCMRKVEVGAGKEFPFDTGTRELTLFVEEGAVTVDGTAVGAHRAYSVPPHAHANASAAENSILYFFEGPQDDTYPATYRAAQDTQDVREKYWGTIESIVSRAYAGKRMLCKTGTHASLEYHCKKLEGYYVHSGALLLRLRAGRGEDRLFEVAAGQTVFIPPGLMHQRGGRKDAVIIEISTKDDDADSFLVEDGQTTPMPGLL